MFTMPSCAGLASLASILLLGAPVLAQISPLYPRGYLEDVCYPATKAGEVVPPCAEITNIEEICKPNGTAPLYLIAHQQCMCGGSYFPEWIACLDCLYFHGLRSERQLGFYQTVLSAASSSFCAAATPSAAFSAVFSSQEAAATTPTTGATASGTDRAPSQAAVSLYYTPSGSIGPGLITGSATAATATTTATVGKGSSSSSSGGSGSGSQTSSASTSASTTTKPNAAGMNRVGAGSMLIVGLIMGSRLFL